MLVAPPVASAAIPPSLFSSCTGEVAAPGFNYVFCDDGVPSFGGTTDNPTGSDAITVPARYGGFAGLPPKAADAASVPGANAAGDVALDVDVSYPASADGPLPLIVMMHGCCAGTKRDWEAQNVAAGQRFDAPGERWHYNNAWFAARGYVVINYTARGFRTVGGHGSTGETQIGSRAYEINDFQSLACQVTGLFNTSPALPDIAPDRVVATGGSYGGGFAWLALTDPRWTCTPETGAMAEMKLAAAAPKYGWTDLLYSLVTSGAHSQSPGKLPAFDGCTSGPLTQSREDCDKRRHPYPIPKRAMTRALFLSGQGAVGANRTTFPLGIEEAFGCLSGPYPPELNPSCGPILERELPAFLSERSAYYQNRWFQRIKSDRELRVPIFVAATFTDPLFTAVESRRMINRLLQVAPRYPVQAYYGDYQLFTQNKAKVWGDVCGAGHHVCTLGDFSAGLSSDPPNLVRLGVTTRLNRFIDHYARPAENPQQGKPKFNVTAEVQACPETAAALKVATDEGGPQFSAPTFEALAPRRLHIELSGPATTTSKLDSNPHATGADPVFSNGARCRKEASDAGPGVAVFESNPLRKTYTMLGATGVRIEFKVSGDRTSLQLDSRLYDLFPDDISVMVDRGPRRVRPGEAKDGLVAYQLQGNGWRFAKGHRIQIEITQDDEPYLHRSDRESSTRITEVRLSVPVRGKKRRGR